MAYSTEPGKDAKVASKSQEIKAEIHRLGRQIKA
jgi:hypothetical protein